MQKAKVNFSEFFLSVVILLLIILSSFLVIRFRNDDSLNEQEMIEKLVTGSNLGDFSDVKNNTQYAISKYNKKSIDPEPVLVFAHIEEDSENPKATLSLLSYDEDGDLSGILIKEKHIDSSGNEMIFEEEYPVFIFWKPPKGVFMFFIFNHIRKNGQIKSEEIWKRYIDGLNVEKSTIRSVVDWERTLPEVFVSVPEPNKVEVEMYLYDRAGHKSKPVLLRHVGFWAQDAFGEF